MHIWCIVYSAPCVGRIPGLEDLGSCELRVVRISFLDGHHALSQLSSDSVRWLSAEILEQWTTESLSGLYNPRQVNFWFCNCHTFAYTLISGHFPVHALDL